MSPEPALLAAYLRAGALALDCTAQNVEQGYRPAPAELVELARTAEVLAGKLRAAAAPAPLVIDAVRADR
ncbi:hypothetical protein [Saccharopolyspora cebuensis]|uniref:Uncharacterized protein n=1 Tax=Saccharopolyspora cebuensis TaxID=418759 RepID=A0ABV4CLX5_9PSEU